MSRALIMSKKLILDNILAFAVVVFPLRKPSTTKRSSVGQGKVERRITVRIAKRTS